MANIALNKPSGGQLILSPEDGTSTETVTIPSVGVGKVLQMVQTSGFNTEATGTSNNWMNSNIVLSITPTRADSKIVIATQAWCSANNAYSGIRLHLTRNGSTIVNTLSLSEFYIQNSVYWEGQLPFTVVDVPNTTSPLEYRIVFSSPNNSSLVRCGVVNRDSYITLMEVAA
jgi:hypothetical protein